jgi:FkbH-like protein
MTQYIDFRGFVTNPIVVGGWSVKASDAIDRFSFLIHSHNQRSNTDECAFAAECTVHVVDHDQFVHLIKMNSITRSTTTQMNAADFALQRAAWQPMLFGTPNRAAIAACIPRWECKPVRVRVHCNHGFEAVSSVCGAYAAWNGIAFDWRIGSYDDSLSFGLEERGEIELIWFDSERVPGLANGKLAEWLVERLRALRSSTTNPIVALIWPLRAVDRERIAEAALPATYVPNLQPLADQLAERWLDRRAMLISGTRLSNRACMEIARELACCWLPAATMTLIKAVAVDLDGTLYSGVLGEDGPSGIEVGEGHIALQQCLGELRASGILLALVTRNELRDVEELFARRVDFPLRLDDFSVIEASWGDKASALDRVAAKLGIGAETIVFIDDNPGELSEVAASSGAVVVHAGADGAETARALVHVSGIFRWRRSAEDGLRDRDLRASEQRAGLARTAVSTDEYLRSLQVRLGYFIGAREHIARVAELASKTNQFNLSLRRLNEADIARRLEERPANVVAIRLEDRLSDSGIVAAVVGLRQGNTLHIEEICISCRALGRRLEDSMLTRALRLFAGEQPLSRIAFDVCNGPRNEPARRWLAQYLNIELDDDATSVEADFEVVRAKTISPAIQVEVAT